MVTTATRHHRRIPAGTLRTAAPFFAVLAARHGIPAPDAPTPARTPATASSAAQDARPTLDRLPSLEDRR